MKLSFFFCDKLKALISLSVFILFFTNQALAGIHVIVLGASHSGGIQQAFDQVSPKGALTNLAKKEVVEANKLGYLGPKSADDYIRLMADRSQYIALIKKQLPQWLEQIKQNDPKALTIVSLPEFIWMRIVTSREADSSKTSIFPIQTYTFGESMELTDLADSPQQAASTPNLQELVDSLKYHLDHRPQNIADHRQEILDEITNLTDFLNELSSQYKVVFVLAGLPYSEYLPALKGDMIHLYEGLESPLTFGAMFKPEFGVMATQIPQMTQCPLQELEAIHNHTESKVSKSKSIKFINIGQEFRENGGLVVVDTTDGQGQFSFEELLNTEEANSLHLKRDFYSIMQLKMIHKGKELLEGKYPEEMKELDGQFINAKKEKELLDALKQQLLDANSSS